MRSAGDDGWGWVTADKVETWRVHEDRLVHDVRPLVVLDLGSVSALEVAQTIRYERDAWDPIADQIEAQTKPPRIPEPGLWGVVEAGQLGTNEGARSEWTRFRHGWADEITGPIRWDQLVGPTLIREGVES
jgi:hypothetical protein